MNSTRPIVASLAAPHLSRFAPTIDIQADRYGDLPALLVDPIDTRGRRIEGLWLLEGDLSPSTVAVYRWIESRAL